AGARSGVWVVCDAALAESDTVYSFGVGNNVAWELALIERFGVTVHAFDPTPEAVRFVESQDLPEKFIFHPIGLSARDGTARFRAPRKTGKVNFQPERPGLVASDDGTWIDCEVRRLPTLMTELGHDHLAILKVDIEGGEYEVMGDLVDSAPAQLLLEFHHNMDGIPFERTRAALDRAANAGYRIFDISMRGLEFSLLRR
ncbi:MAG: FkbM family methyltransferase, partial [Gammaproteobacteria bacterium]